MICDSVGLVLQATVEYALYVCGYACGKYGVALNLEDMKIEWKEIFLDKITYTL